MTKTLLCIITILFLAEGCKTAEKSVPNTKELQQKNIEQQILSGSYTISEIGKKSNFKQELTMTFDESSTSVSGFSGCNTFYGNYSTNGDKVEFKNMFTSKKLCLEGPNNIERQFLEVLKNTKGFKIIGDTIQLFSNDKLLLKATKNVASKPSKSEIAKEYNDQTLVTYQLQSRSVFEYIQVSESEVKISSDRTLKSINTYPIKARDWKAVKKMLKNTPIESLDQIKAPTDKRLYDGAAHATLSIIRGDVETMTPSFDHGTPPAEIENLVNKVLSIKDTATKQ